MWATSDPNLSVSQLMDKLSTSDSKSRIRNVMSLLSGKPSVQVLIDDLLATLRVGKPLVVMYLIVVNYLALCMLIGIRACATGEKSEFMQKLRRTLGQEGDEGVLSAFETGHSLLRRIGLIHNGGPRP